MDEERKMVYAGDMTEGELIAEGLAPQKQPKNFSNLLLVTVAIIGLVLTVYYIGFGHLNFSFGASPNATNNSQNETGAIGTANTSENGSAVTVPIITSLFYTGSKTTLLSREEFNLTLRFDCNGTCSGAYISLYDGSSLLASYADPAPWTSSKNATIAFVVPRRINATLALEILADSRNSSYTAYGAEPQARKTVYFNVLEGTQNIIYGKEFYLDVGESGNLSDLNVKIRLDSLSGGNAKISVIKKDNISFGSTLNMLNKPNATFFDFLTIQLLATSSQAKLIAWPNGMLEAVSLQSPLADNITIAETFQIYLRCTGTCAATYVGIHLLYQTNLTRIGFYNQTIAWNGSQTVDIPVSIPYFYENTTSEVKILADTRSAITAFYFDMWHLPEKMMNKSIWIE